MPRFTLYDFLGVKPDDKPQIIEKALDELEATWSPAQTKWVPEHRAKDAAEIYKEIKEARRLLTDDDLRRSYNAGINNRLDAAKLEKSETIFHEKFTSLCKLSRARTDSNYYFDVLKGSNKADAAWMLTQCSRMIGADRKRAVELATERLNQEVKDLKITVEKQKEEIKQLKAGLHPAEANVSKPQRLNPVGLQSILIVNNTNAVFLEFINPERAIEFNNKFQLQKNLPVKLSASSIMPNCLEVKVRKGAGLFGFKDLLKHPEEVKSILSKAIEGFEKVPVSYKVVNIQNSLA